MIKRVLLMGLICQFFFLATVMGQVDRATMTGAVTDPSGAAVPGVVVTATNVNTHVQEKTETNEAGLYRIMNLPVGPYSLAFEKAGFAKLVRSGIVLTVAQVAEINVSLKLSAVAQTIQVTEAAPLLETATAEVGTALTNREVEGLPLTISGARDVENFAYAVMPNVDGNNWTSYIAGTPAFTKSVLLDGTLEQGSESGSFDEMFPSMDAVDEFKVETGGTSGQAAANTAGGTFMFTLKSGTNQWHGSAFEFDHNTALNANTWMGNFNGSKTPIDHENDYGFSLGGPIKKNKTFFYWAWERYMLTNYAMTVTTVPTAAFLNGDFSSLLGGPVLDKNNNPVINPCTGQAYMVGQILDPATSTTVGGQTCASPFSGNVIPSKRFSTVAQKLIAIYQQDYQPLNNGVINNAMTPAGNNPWFHMNQYSLKVDHNISANDRFAGSYIGTSRPRYLIDSTSSIWQQGTTNGGPLSQDRLQDVSTQQLRLSENHNFSGSGMNVFSFTALSYVNPTQPVTENGNWAQTLGLGSTLENYGGIPVINFGSAVNGVAEDTIGENNTNGYLSNIFEFDDAFTKLHGRHTLNFGGTLRAFQMNSHSRPGYFNITFANDQTGQPQNSNVAPYVGFGFASFLLGDVQSASEGTPLNLYGRRKGLSLYASDSFKVNPKLTLTMSLTFNQSYHWHEKYGNWANFSNTLVSPELGAPGAIQYASGPSDSFEGPLYWGAFAPSVGVAYQITHKVVARGSYSMFYTPIASNYWFGVPYGYAPQVRGTDEVLKTGTMAAAFNWDGGYPGVYVPGTKDPNYLAWGPVTMSPNSLTPGRINQWNVGAEIELARNTRLNLYYLGNRGTHLPDGELQNDGPTPTQEPGYLNMLKNGTEWNWVWDNASAKAAGVTLPYSSFSNYAFMADSSFPQVAGLWSPIYYVGSPLGKSRFDSFTAEVTRRVAPGLSMDMSYGFEHQASDLDPYYGNFAETWLTCDYYCIQDLNSGYGGNYIKPYNTQIVKGFVQYDLPFGKGRRFLSSANKGVDVALGGWRLGLIVYYGTGVPLTVNSNNYYPGWPTVVYSNVASGANFSSKFNKSGFNPIFNTTPQAPNQYFTGSDFSNPSYGALGNSGPWVPGLLGFGYSDEDLGIYKTFNIGERVQVQLRGEFFNSLNRHFYSNPNTDIGSPLLGYVTSVTGSPRQGQVGLRITF